MEPRDGGALGRRRLAPNLPEVAQDDAEVDLGIVLRYLRQIGREAPAAKGAAVSRFHLSRRFPRALFSDAVEWLEGHRE